MNQTIKIKNEVDCTTIDIEGTIGISEQWQFDNPDSRVATYERFRECVSQIADIQNARIIVNIRSTGGDVNDAILIYEALRNTGAHITTCCYGYTASAATIVAQAASEGCRLIAPSSLYLIHNSLCATEGNADEIEMEVAMLRQTDRRLAEIYAARSNRNIEDIAALMGANGGRGRWLSPEEAVAEGLADSITSQPILSEKDSPSTIAQRAVHGVKALLKAIGINSPTTPEDDVNVISHRDTATSSHISPLTLDERQRSVTATPISEVEDPSPMDNYSSPRTKAYEHDARSLRNR